MTHYKSHGCYGPVDEETRAIYVERMAARLVELGTYADEREAIRSLFGRYNIADILMLIDDARAGGGANRRGAGDVGAMMLKTDTTGFVRGGMLFLEPPWRWRVFQRDVWACCNHFLLLGLEVQMVCSPSCFGKITAIASDNNGPTFEVAWEDGPVCWHTRDGLRVL